MAHLMQNLVESKN